VKRVIIHLKALSRISRARHRQISREPDTSRSRYYKLCGCKSVDDMIGRHEMEENISSQRITAIFKNKLKFPTTLVNYSENFISRTPREGPTKTELLTSCFMQIFNKLRNKSRSKLMSKLVNCWNLLVSHLGKCLYNSMEGTLRKYLTYETIPLTRCFTKEIFTILPAGLPSYPVLHLSSTCKLLKVYKV
jgi:hypothetical protein